MNVVHTLMPIWESLHSHQDIWEDCSPNHSQNKLLLDLVAVQNKMADGETETYHTELSAESMMPTSVNPLAGHLGVQEEPKARYHRATSP